AKKFYVTTPIYYINAVPHIGNAYSTVVADVLARWHRLRGDDVFFLTGLDENSARTVEAAKKQGFKDIQAYADSMAKKWINAWKVLDISYNDFIRTTQERHKRNVRNFFKQLQKSGDVYKGTYEGLYCEGCESYLTESDLEDGKCPLHKKKPKRIKEKNYFFRLSKYRDQILTYIEANPKFVQPESRRNEVLSFLQKGLKDISISRPGLEWGIKVPSDPEQTIWIWIDALLNYMLPRNFWPADTHIIAKDILRFHCVIWPGMLLSTGYDLPKRIFVHGFLTVKGQKISKSLGNVIDPVYLAKRYSVDALRYSLVREVTLGQDGDFSEEILRTRLNAELADVLGNFAHRVLTFIKNNFDGKVPKGRVDRKLETEIQNQLGEVEKLFGELKITQALEKIILIARRGNEYFQSHKPWKTVKTERPEAANCLLNCANLLKALCIALSPFMPTTCEKLAEQLNLEIKSWRQTKKFDIKPGHIVKKPKILFKKVKAKSKESKGKKTSVSIEDFNKLDIRVGKIIKAMKLPKSKKLLKLEVDVADERRTLVAGIAKDYPPDELVGKRVAVVVNLKPAKIMGIESQGMLLAGDDGKKISLLTTDKPIKPGARVK
ncbi:MAG: methionine--tRNA ligase, partial [Candidatus Hadarchaeota archaeon]|nr:methionine--tRNA ligase [Candidatus Hadarchaeota archaeon]